MSAAHPVPDERLILALPRRGLYGLSGYHADIQMSLLDYITSEAYFVSGKVLAGDSDSKELRVGIIARRDGDRAILLTDDGVLLHTAPVPDDVLRHNGDILRALRLYVQGAANALLNQKVQTTLVGYFNEDGLHEAKDFFTLVYETRAPAEVPAPSGMQWVQAARLEQIPMEAASALVAAGLMKQGSAR